MCLAIPARIIDIEGDMAHVDFGGVVRDAAVTLIEDPAVGDFVIVHAGFAIQKLDEEDALETLKLFKELAEAGVFE